MTANAPPHDSAAPRSRWRAASALGATQIFSFGTSYYLLGVLSQPIQAETGWSPTFLSGAQSFGMLVAGVIAPAVGRAIERRGGRGPLTLGFLMFALGLALIGAAPNRPAFVAGWAVLGLGMGMAFYDSVFSALGKAFGAQARPAISVVTLWGGFASTVCWPLSAALVEPLGWRGVCFVYAAIHLAVCIPLVAWGLPAEQKRGGGEAAPAHHALPVQAPDSRLFVLIAAIFVVNGVLMTTVYVHLMEFLQARGLTLAEAVAVGTLLGPAQVGARALELAYGSRRHPIVMLLAALGAIAAGALLFAAGFAAVGVAVVLFAAGNGLYSIVRGTLPLALFGAGGYATIMGRLGRPVFVAQALAPALGAWLLTRLGASGALWVVAGGAAANLAAGIALARKGA